MEEEEPSLHSVSERPACPSHANISSMGGPSSPATFPSMDLNEVQLEICSHPSPEHAYASEVVRPSVAQQARRVLAQNIADSIDRGTAVDMEDILVEPALVRVGAAAALPPAPPRTTSMDESASRSLNEGGGGDVGGGLRDGGEGGEGGGGNPDPDPNPNRAAERASVAASARAASASEAAALTPRATSPAAGDASGHTAISMPVEAHTVTETDDGRAEEDEQLVVVTARASVSSRESIGVAATIPQWRARARARASVLAAARANNDGGVQSAYSGTEESSRREDEAALTI